jgi:hypothetical protein
MIPAMIGRRFLFQPLSPHERTPHMTQAQIILRHIKSLGSISPQEAFRDYQITRLAARILDLKKAGYRIETEMREHPLTGTRYARYTLMLETSGKTNTSCFVIR